MCEGVCGTCVCGRNKERSLNLVDQQEFAYLLFSLILTAEIDVRWTKILIAAPYWVKDSNCIE